MAFSGIASPAADPSKTPERRKRPMPMKARQSPTPLKSKQTPVKSKQIPATPKESPWMKYAPPDTMPSPSWTKHPPADIPPPNPNDVTVQGTYDVERISKSKKKKKKVRLEGLTVEDKLENLLADYRKLAEENGQLKTELRQSKKLAKKWKTLSEKWKERAMADDVATDATLSSLPLPAKGDGAAVNSRAHSQKMPTDPSKKDAPSPEKISPKTRPNFVGMPVRDSQQSSSCVGHMKMGQDPANFEVREGKSKKIWRKGLGIVLGLTSLRKSRGQTIYHEAHVLGASPPAAETTPQKGRLKFDSTEKFATLELRLDPEASAQQYSAIKHVLCSSKHTFDAVDEGTPQE